MKNSLLSYFRARYQALLNSTAADVQRDPIDAANAIPPSLAQKLPPESSDAEGIDVILTHEHTDFDALASLFGAALLYPNARPVLPRRINRNVHGFLALYRNHFPFLTYRELPAAKVRRAILVDARAVNWVRGMDKHTTLHIIDHHALDPDKSADSSAERHATVYSEPVGANTTLLLELLIRQATERNQPIKLTPVQATLLALGIHEDTGSLTYPSTTHRDAHCLAWLLEPDHGVNLEVLGRFLNHSLNAEQRELLETLIENSDFQEVAGHTVVIAHADAPDFGDELSALVGRLRNYHEAEAVLMVVRLQDIVQLVARSMTDEIDVGKIARALGGGGHTRAAAAPIPTDRPLAEILQQVLAEVRRHARPAISVAQIMSTGRPQTLSPNLSVAEASQLMSRYGHEGFPVIETDPAGHEVVLGVLTRREADRAISHKMGDQPVARFMRAGSVTITPRASIGDLRKLMTETNWGQIPVLDDGGHIIGIVTRTDLIKLWDEAALPESHAPAVAEKLQRVLRPGDLALLRRVGKEVEHLKFSVYVVGGFVRDLLLNHTTEPLAAKDMDIVIEGDAIAFAQHWAGLYGGRVVPHRRFNTAKWILDDEEFPINTDRLAADLDLKPDTLELGDHLDFVSARTEFYNAPTALPTVEDSSIKLDLHRRDFTVNTLAICLNPPRWGELLDFYGGLKDLDEKYVRILHSLSFVDDPTRILRAVRYEQRFGFQIEPRTLELLHDAVELLPRMTPARLRHEFERIFQENYPERALLRLAELGILRAIHPALSVDAKTAVHISNIRSALADPSSADALRQNAPDDLYWGALAFRLNRQQATEVVDRLGLQNATRQVIFGLVDLRACQSALLDPDILPSQVAAALDSLAPAALSLALLFYAEQPAIRYLVDSYLQHWRHVRAELDGNDLTQMGIPQGPVYRTILTALRNAKMNGEVTTRAQEERLAREIFRRTAPN